MAYKVQIQFDEPMPECCSYCRFNYDWLYCTLDMDDRTTTSDEGRPSHCKLMQTEAVREVVHGHWIVTGRTNVYGGMEVTCSECGDTLMIQYLELEHFCRNCGADMRGEK